MTAHEPRWATRTDDWEQVVRGIFAEQRALALIGAELGRVEPGLVEVELPARPEVTQQHGTVHGGLIGLLADTAGALAALTVAPPDVIGMTVEYKLNLLAPAYGERVVAQGRLLRPGRPLSVSACDVYAIDDGVSTLCATALLTLAGSRGRSDGGGR